MNSTIEMPAPTVEPRCQIEEVFAQSFIDLLNLAPRNPVVRGLILSLTRKLPPAECQSYEQVKTWVEHNCEKRLRPPNANGTNPGIKLRVELSEREYGRASYSVQRNGTDDFELEADELVSMAQVTIEGGGSMDSLIESIATKIEEDAWDQCSPCMDDYSDYDYDEHDQSDFDGQKVQFSRSELRQRVASFLREQHPELLEELA